jgi:hypothetical protein
MSPEVPSSTPFPSRRKVLEIASLLPLAALVPELLAASRAVAAGTPYRFFTVHQGAVVDAATRRIAPGPQDDPLEAGHPGAAEAGVVRYVDTLLAMFSFNPPRLFTGGPWSNRPAGGPDHMASFTPPDAAQASSWRQRVDDLQGDYRTGIALLDSAAGGDFTTVTTARQDGILASPAAAGFTATLFQHTCEGMYSNPEYGGNNQQSGWLEIGYPGDSQPVGYTAAEMSRREGSLLEPTGVVAALLGLLGGAAGASAERSARATVRGGRHA